MNLKIDLYDLGGATVLPKKGRILISEPFLNDSYFKRSIVLLTEHNSQGSVGFVLNKPVELNITEILEDFPAFDAHVSLGGPVQTHTVHYLHTLGEEIPESIPVLPGIYWGGSFDAIKDQIISGKLKKEEIRFFIGYSGWRPKQLEGELEQNAWVVADIDPGKVMGVTLESSWQRTLENLGEKYKIWINTPENPGLN